MPVSPQARTVLGIDSAVGALPADELIAAILAAPVDLLWNGGIGTYVKASTESQADLGDKTKHYALKFLSAEGKQDGLYWKTSDNDPPSPIGPLIADAAGDRKSVV